VTHAQEDGLPTDDEYNDFETSTSSEETLKGYCAGLKGRRSLRAGSGKEQRISQLTRWAHESCRTRLTLAEILHRTQWEAARFERL
jgi:hypothetical protein